MMKTEEVNKRPTNSSRALLCLSALAVVLCIGCEMKSTAVRSATATRPARYVKALFEFPASFDPSQMNDLYAIEVSNLIYSGLLEFTDNLELRGDLAQSWKTSRDGKTVSFVLRDGLRFSDGTPISAEHIVRSFSRLVAPKSLVYDYYDCIDGAPEYHAGRAKSVKGLIALSTRELAIRLRYPFPPFLSVLAGGTAKVLPISSGAAFDEEKFFRHPVGAGPFKISKLGPKVLELKRNEIYHGRLPKIEELVFDFSPTPIAVKKAMRGEIHDLTSLPMLGTEQVFQKGQYYPSSLAETWIIGLNSRLKPFDKVATRRAFKHSIPIEEFRKRFQPLSLRSNGYVPPGLPGHLSARDLPSRDRETGKIPQTPITLAFPAALDRGPEMRAFLEEQLRRAGWNVRVVEMPWDQLLAGYTKKTWQAFLVTMNMDYPDPEFLFRNFESTNLDNFSGINDPRIDSLLTRARGTRDGIERSSLYRQLSLLVDELAPVVPLLHPRGHYWVSACVRGFKPNPLSHAYTDYREISLASNCGPAVVARGGDR